MGSGLSMSALRVAAQPANQRFGSIAELLVVITPLRLVNETSCHAPPSSSLLASLAEALVNSAVLPSKTRDALGPYSGDVVGWSTWRYASR